MQTVPIIVLRFNRGPTVGVHQAGIFREDTGHHIYLEFRIAASPGRLAGGELLDPADGIAQVIAFGSRLAAGLADVAAPPATADFEAIGGDGAPIAPATQADLFIWLHGDVRGELFARALAWRAALGGLGELAREDHGFRFRDSRDLTGFVDGTANPKGDNRQQVALVADGIHAGGSFVLAQRWVHDLAAFNALAVADQERVFGRTKADSVELAGSAMPKDSHVARTDLPGAAIYRRSAPTGGVGDAGLFFLAFSADPARFSRLLQSMFGAAVDGRVDRLLRYSKPVSGAFYYAPPNAALRRAFR